MSVAVSLKVSGPWFEQKLHGGRLLLKFLQIYCSGNVKNLVVEDNECTLQLIGASFHNIRGGGN